MSDRTFGAKLGAAYGLRIKTKGIIRRMDPILDARHFNRFIKRYARDTTKDNYQSPEKVEASLPVGVDYEDMVIEGKAPLKPGDGEHYIDFGNNLWFFGSANSPIVTAGLDPFTLPENERLEYITGEWLRSTKHMKKVAHHLVASLDPRLCNSLVRSGYPADAVVISSLADAMQVLNGRFYPGESMGMICGIHHDRPHIHAHVLVHPLTDHGRRINMTVDGSCTISGQKYRIPYQRVLKQAYAEAIDDFCGTIFPPPRQEEKKVKLTRMAAVEDLILLRRCLSEPALMSQDKNSGVPPQFKFAGIRERLVSDPRYQDIITSAHADQVRTAPARLQTIGQPYLTHKFKTIHESMQKATDPLFLAGDDLFLHVNALKAPDLAVGPFHHPGVLRALSRTGWASKQGIENDQRPAVQVARRLDAVKARLKACRAASEALIAATDGYSEALDTHYAWAAQTTGVVLTGAGGWQNKMESFLEEWEGPSEGEQRLVPRAKLIGSMDEELVHICRGISQRYRAATLDDLELYTPAPKVEKPAGGKPEYEEGVAIETEDESAEAIESEFSEAPGRISADIDFDNPLTRISAMRQCSFLSDPLRVRLGDLLDMAQKKLGDSSQPVEPEI